MDFFKTKKSKKTENSGSGDSIINTVEGSYKYEGVIEEGGVSLVDCICPPAVDTANPGYIMVDGVHIATLLVISYPYQRAPGWLSDIISYGEGVEVTIYYEPLDKAKVVKEITHMIGITGAKKKAAGENQSDAEIIDTSLGHAKYMRREMNINNEDPYYIYILVSVYGESRELFEDRLKAVESMLGSMDIMSKRADFRHEKGFTACLPLHQLPPGLRKATRRNALTTGAASTYPFVSSEFCDDNGVLVGINEHNNSLVIVDFFNTSLYKNANMVIMGTSGAGKTYLLQLLALRLRLQDIQVMIIAPLKGMEFRRACDAVGGTFIKIAPGSPDCINIFDIRKSTLEMEFEDEECTTARENGQTSILASKIQKLQIFFSLVFPDITREEKQYLEKKLIEVYAGKSITFDNESLYSSETGSMFSLERRFKEMPLMEDLYRLLQQDVKTQRLATLLESLVHGSLKSFNSHTNVNLENKYIIADISNLNDELLPLGMFLTIELFWDIIKEDRTKKKTIFVDEIWRLIGGGGNRQTAQFILEIFKIIRGYGGSAVAATQDVSDFFVLEDGKYSKGIINNSKLKFVLQLEEDEAKSLERVLKLSEEEIAKITAFERGHALFYAGNNHVALEVKASQEEREMITTDRGELEELRRCQIKTKLYSEK